MSLSGPAFTWFSSLPVNSIANCADLEKKFHTYFYTRIGEKKITDLTTIRQRTNELGIEFLQRFRETRNWCFSLNLVDDQLAALAVQRMLPTWKEKLLGQEFDNLGQLAQRLAALNSQFQSMRRDTQFQKKLKLMIHTQSMTAMKMKKKKLLQLNEIGARRQWWCQILGEEESRRAMTLMSPNQINSLISY